MTKQKLNEALLYLLFIGLAIATYGYRYGLGNQVDLLPAIYHLIDPSVLANDLAASSYPVYARSLVWLIAQIGRIIPLPVVLLFFHLFSLFLLFYAIRKIVEAVAPGQTLVGWMTIFLLIVIRYLVPGDNLVIGGFDLFEVNFYGYTLGYALVLLSLAFLARGNIALAGLISGLTMYVHVNYGEQAFLLGAGCLLLKKQGVRGILGTFGKFITISLAVAAPILILTFFHEFLQPSEMGASALPVATYLDVDRFRAAHHATPSAWPIANHIEFLVLNIGLWLLIGVWRKQDRNPVDAVWGRVALVILFLCGLGYANELLESGFLAKSYLFRMSAVLKVLAFVYGCWALWRYVIKGLNERARSRLTRYTLALLTLYSSAALAINIAVAQNPESFGQFTKKLYLGVNFSISRTPLEQWIYDNTPTDAIFLTSPNYSTFAANTERSSVVNWIDEPYGRDLYYEWYKRIVDVSDSEITLASTRSIGDSWEIGRMVRAAYYRLSASKIASIAAKYNAEYCIFTEGLPFEVKFRWKGLVLYRMPSGGT
jgi:hypothetical protein